jgi:hypothetical protein
MTRRLAGLPLVTAVAIAGTAALPAAAGADTVRIGSALQQPDTPSICTNCVGVQRARAAGAPLPLTSPANGTVISWSVRSSEPGALHALRILRPAGGTSYTGAGTNAAPPVPTTLDSILNYVTSLPIKQGDAVGVQVTGGGGLPQFTSNNPADVLGYSTTVFADGSSAAFTELGGHELLLQATIKFCNVPSVKGRKIGAAKQALTAADCTPKVKKKEARKKKNRAKVLKQKKQPGTTAAPGTVVTILVGKKPKN